MHRTPRHFLAPFMMAVSLAVVLLPGGYFSGFADPLKFVGTFPGTPSSPLPFHPNNWDVTILSENRDKLIAPMNAGHGADCSPPPATHTVTSLQDAVYICKDHLMTAMNAGYGAIYLTPDAMMDWSSGEAVLTWDMSTLRTSSRDWVDIVVMPYDESLQLNYEDVHRPQDAIHLEMIGGGNLFMPTVTRNYQEDQVPSDMFTSYNSFLTPSAVRRDTFELRVSKNHIKFGMPAYNFWWLDAEIAPLNWSQGVVQLNHRSYNPDKACNFDGSCGPNTWHWSNVGISPAAPFTISKADRAYVSSDTPGQVTFAQPAPANAHLRFQGLGKPLQISVDGGQSWQAAQIMGRPIDKEEHPEAYWTPIPAGTTSVQIRGQRWFGGDWIARDISVWGPGASAPGDTVAAPAVTVASPAQVPQIPQVTTETAAPPVATNPQQAPVALQVDPASGKTNVTFDDLDGENVQLDGQYPAGLIDWGSNAWFHSGPFGAFSNKSVSFNGGGPTNASLNVLAARRLDQLDAYNGGTEASTITLSCEDQPQAQATLQPGQLATIQTGWTRNCTSITIGSTNGWDTNFKNLVFSAAGT